MELTDLMRYSRKTLSHRQADRFLSIADHALPAQIQFIGPRFQRLEQALVQGRMATIFQVFCHQGQAVLDFPHHKQTGIAFLRLHPIEPDDQPTLFFQSLPDFGPLRRPQQGQKVSQNVQHLALRDRDLEIFAQPLMQLRDGLVHPIATIADLDNQFPTVGAVFQVQHFGFLGDVNLLRLGTGRIGTAIGPTDHPLHTC